ncbi:hypothetical protein SNEBB_004750 [Seison nebaliae]|nr:hypothetical protein SNEBB_004750 [Seison nebaliae]
MAPLIKSGNLIRRLPNGEDKLLKCFLESDGVFKCTEIMDGIETLVSTYHIGKSFGGLRIGSEIPKEILDKFKLTSLPNLMEIILPQTKNQLMFAAETADDAYTWRLTMLELRSSLFQDLYRRQPPSPSQVTVMQDTNLIMGNNQLGMANYHQDANGNRIGLVGREPRMPSSLEGFYTRDAYGNLVYVGNNYYGYNRRGSDWGGIATGMFLGSALMWPMFWGPWFWF